MQAWLRQHALPLFQWTVREASHLAAHLLGEVILQPSEKKCAPPCPSDQVGSDLLESLRSEVLSQLKERSTIQYQVYLLVGLLCFLTGVVTGYLVRGANRPRDGARAPVRRRGAGVLVGAAAR